MITSFFVYGTLKSDQCRSQCWPAEPIEVEPAWIRGELYGRSDYPALGDGEQKVIGQWWRFDPRSVTAVIETLDRIEGTNQPGQPNLYDRIETLATRIGNGQTVAAYTYRYSGDPRQHGFERLEPDFRGYVMWP